MIHLGRNKRSMTLDLSCEAGRETLKELVKVSDVLTENFKPNTMDKLGVGYSVLREVNPRLIYACVSGFGHHDIAPSPYSDRPAFNMIAQAMSGILGINGHAGAPPCPVPVAIGDFIPAMWAAIGVLAALEHRSRTGLGQMVDVAMYDALIPLTVRQTMKYALTGQVQQRGAEMFNSLLGIFEASDGFVSITILGQAAWERLCRLIDRPDMIDSELFNTDRKRGHGFDQHIRPVLEEWARDKTKHEATELFLAHNLAAGPINTIKDVFEDPHVAARGMLVEVGDMDGGTVKVPNLPIKFSQAQGVPPTEAPLLGRDTAAVLREFLGLDDAAIQDLARAGATRRLDSGESR
jgi:crotonobetainyl-CoA:carnitine CoA-transferase CaiB-like acyl-CoA transferase